MNKAAAPSSSASRYHALLPHERRFRQLVVIGCVVLGARGLASVAGEGWFVTLMLLGGIAALLACQWLFRRGHVILAYWALVNLMLALVFGLAWFSEGLYDAAIMALPAILLVTGLLLPYRHFIGIVCETFVLVLLLAYASEAGWRPAASPGPLHDRLIDVAAILAASALAVWVMTRDMRHLVASLRAEIGRGEQVQAELRHASEELQQHRDRLEHAVAERTAELERRNAELVAQRDEIERLAHHDALTGLPTSRVARDRLRVACELSRRTKGWIGLLFIDLDGFKAVNDTHGHDAGDHVLRVVAERLNANIRSADTAARQGGDEFIVILNEGADAERVAQVAERIIATLCEPIDYRGLSLQIGASIGIALCPSHASNPEDLLKKADQAMYAVKRAGKNGYALFQ